MLENLTDRLQSVIKTIRGQARFTEQNISDAMREVRIALIEADVALAVVKDFIDRVKTKALGVEVLQSLSPGQAIIKIVQDELTILRAHQRPRRHPARLREHGGRARGRPVERRRRLLLRGPPRRPP